MKTKTLAQRGFVLLWYFSGSQKSLGSWFTLRMVLKAFKTPRFPCCLFLWGWRRRGGTDGDVSLSLACVMTPTAVVRDHPWGGPTIPLRSQRLQRAATPKGQEDRAVDNNTSGLSTGVVTENMTSVARDLCCFWHEHSWPLNHIQICWWPHCIETVSCAISNMWLIADEGGDKCLRNCFKDLVLIDAAPYLQVLKPVFSWHLWRLWIFSPPEWSLFKSLGMNIATTMQSTIKKILGASS